MVSDEQFEQQLHAIDQEEQALYHRQVRRRRHTEDLRGSPVREATVLNNRACELQDRDQHSEAHRLFLRAWELNPSDELIRENLISASGYYGENLKEFERWQEILDVLVPLQERGLSGWLMSSVTSDAYLGLGMIDEAIHDAEDSVGFRHTSSQYLHLGRCYAEKVKAEETSSPESDEFLIKAAQAYANAYRLSTRPETSDNMQETMADAAAIGAVITIKLSNAENTDRITKLFIEAPGLTLEQQEDCVRRIMDNMFKFATPTELEDIKTWYQEQGLIPKDENAT